ncbi:HK97 family phage prohead protease [Mycolicibacter algericus]|uniref:Prohead serine protease domain-containing protein n=2 Tax=Mycolicibacter algericus TaxID=1288388 RepID=A0A7I9Y3Y8_MYCAL|nr:HK97 family phage prohead protease [Mycolicibacter algericus]OQZ96922.1 primosomal replication protein N [Mycolicibacter algericus DSM 45454]GFG83382.1 hypothetical protein MALGJ_00580 [Mycolicibacter algericus]
MSSKKHARSDLCRFVEFERADGDINGDGRTFRGYGAVFNSPTRIDSWEGRFDEQFAPSAFRKTIRENTPKFQFDHGRHPLIGSVPIGVITSIAEDERGLDVQARLGQHLFIDFIQEALSTGAINGMSIRFSVVREEWRDATGSVVPADEVDERLWNGRRGDDEPLLRTILEAKLTEVGPVVWPAYTDTTAGVRSAEPVTIDPARLDEPEQRRLLAELLLRSEQIAQQGDSSDDEPQDTTDVGVEHSEDDTGTPPGTTEDDGHESETPEEHPAPTDDVDAARAAEEERLFADALAEVANLRDSTPPMKGI